MSCVLGSWWGDIEVRIYWVELLDAGKIFFEVILKFNNTPIQRLQQKLPISQDFC